MRHVRHCNVAISAKKKEGSEKVMTQVVKTIDEVANAIKVSSRTVNRWKNDGMPVTIEGYYNIDDIIAWQEGREVIDGEQTDDGKPFWDAKRSKYKAKREKIAYRKDNDEYISVKEVEQDRAERIVAIKNSFLALPTRLAKVLSMKKPREIERILYDEIGNIIDEFANGRGQAKKYTGDRKEGVEATGPDNG